jgi:lysozyme
MADIYKLFEIEEGFRSKPYHCSEGYPTVGFGIKIGPKGAPLSNYTFTVPRTAAEVWLRCYLDEMTEEITKFGAVYSALKALAAVGTGSMYTDPRCSVLLSMCYQMGVAGVDAFRNTLKFMEQGDYTKAATNMLASKWAKQTPDRAQRHAKQMRTGQWAPEYSK